jgi:phosphate transport system protein
VPPTSRSHYVDELQEVEREALSGIDLVAEALDRTLEALEMHDARLADLVIAGDDRIDGRYLAVHQAILSLIARQAPVATDLRLVAALLDVIRHIERMGDQCVNIAKVVQLSPAIPAEDGGVMEQIREMGQLARELVVKSAEAFGNRDEKAAEALVGIDDRLDDLNREMFPRALKLANDPAALEWAMRMVQVARWLERIGDHAVDIGEETAFVATGLFREFEDASHPERSN